MTSRSEYSLDCVAGSKETRAARFKDDFERHRAAELKRFG